MLSEDVCYSGRIRAIAVDVYSPAITSPGAIEIDSVAVVVIAVHCVIKMVLSIFIITFSVKDISTSSFCHDVCCFFLFLRLRRSCLVVISFKKGKIKSAGYKLIVYPVHKDLRIAHSSEINNAKPTLWQYTESIFHTNRRQSLFYLAMSV